MRNIFKSLTLLVVCSFLGQSTAAFAQGLDEGTHQSTSSTTASGTAQNLQDSTISPQQVKKAKMNPFTAARYGLRAGMFAIGLTLIYAGIEIEKKPINGAIAGMQTILSLPCFIFGGLFAGIPLTATSLDAAIKWWTKRSEAKAS